MRLEPRDFYVLELIQRHGPLSKLYLWEFTKHIGKDDTGFRKRLLLLYREGYLERPVSLNHPRLWADYMVYKLTEKGRQALGKKRDKYAQPIPGWDEHAFMTSTITANIELEAKKHGYSFISQEEILARAPSTTQTAGTPLAVPTRITRATAHSDKDTIPDQIFGINYGEGRARFFALETDRGNEPITRRHLHQNSILRKILCYDNILKNGTFKKHFGLSMLPMFVTTSLDRVHNMLELAKAESPKYAHLFLFTNIDGFHEYVKTPPLIPALFGEFRTTTGLLDVTKP